MVQRGIWCWERVVRGNGQERSIKRGLKVAVVGADRIMHGH